MINILVVSPVTPDVISYTTVLFKNLVPLLRNKIKVHVTWFVSSPTKPKPVNHDDSEITILDIHNYNNAIEVLREVRPDLIYSHPGYSPIEYAVALAAKSLGIPVMCGELGTVLYKTSSPLTIIRSYIGQFFQKSVTEDTTQYQTRIMGRGRFFIYKYLFLIKTQQAIKMGKLQMFKEFLLDLWRYLFHESRGPKTISRFFCDLNFLESENQIESFIKAGYKISSLVVTGNPTYDVVFQRLEKFRSIANKDNKIRVLLITTNPDDPGGHKTRKLRDFCVRSIVTEISKHKNDMSLVIKIHPTGEVLSEYQSLVRSIDPSVQVYQKGDLIEFLESADVIIGWSSSTALVISLISRKPIIIWNIFGIHKDVFLERGLAVECKGRKSIMESIHQGISSNPDSQQKTEQFIKQFLYKSDGKATERISNAILNFLQQEMKYALE